MWFVRLYGSRQRYRPTSSNGTSLLVHILCFATDNILGKGKVFPLQARCGPEGG